MNAHTRHEQVRALRATRQQAADLLARYPDVSEAEAKQILAFLRHGRHLDVGMLTADERLKPQLDLFTADHAKHLRVGVIEGATVVGAIVGFLALCWLVWEAVGPAAV
jgi:hypothetical protein